MAKPKKRINGCASTRPEALQTKYNKRITVRHRCSNPKCRKWCKAVWHEEPGIGVRRVSVCCGSRAVKERYQ